MSAEKMYAVKATPHGGSAWMYVEAFHTTDAADKCRDEQAKKHPSWFFEVVELVEREDR